MGCEKIQKEKVIVYVGFKVKVFETQMGKEEWVCQEKKFSIHDMLEN